MHRRSFFSALSSAVVGVYLGCHVNLKKLVDVGLKEEPVAYVGINPAWVNAPYEVAFLVQGGHTVFDRKLQAFTEGIALKVADPIRVSEDGDFVPKYAAVHKRSPTI